MAAFYGRTHVSDSWTSWSSEAEVKPGHVPQLFWLLRLAFSSLIGSL